jgi:hypothetical protein
VTDTSPWLLEHRWGRGRAVTHTWSIGRAYHDLALADVRAAIAASLGDLLDKFGIETTLPDCIECAYRGRPPVGCVPWWLAGTSPPRARARI